MKFIKLGTRILQSARDKFIKQTHVTKLSIISIKQITLECKKKKKINFS